MPFVSFSFFVSRRDPVDTFRHVVTHIQADFADEKDSRHLLDIVNKTKLKLKSFDRKMLRVLADGGFSSGSNYAQLEAAHLEGYVALYGQYTKVREGFTRVASTMMLSEIFITVSKGKN